MIISQRTHIINNLHKIRSENGKISSTKINSQINRELKQKIIQYTNFLPDNCSFSERIFCIINNITSRPICDITNNHLKWSPAKNEYNQSKQKSYRTRKLNQTNIRERYDLIKTTLKERYSSNSYNLLNLDQIRMKIQVFNTNIKLWDIEKDYDLFCSVLSHTHFLPNTAKWGERFYCINNNIISKVICKDGGDANYINSKEGYSMYSSRKNQHQFKLDYIRQYVEERFEIVDDITTIKDQKNITIRCKTCNTQKSQLFICGYWQDICCNKCTGYGYNRSKAEDEINQFITNFNIITEQNTTIDGVSELDIYIPSKKVAIEYNGILWHSYGATYPNNVESEKIKKYREYHKKIECEKRDINLITIFETDWLYKKDIVKSILKSKLGIYTQTIYARKCQVKILTKAEKTQFYKNNHIQGDCQSFYDIGLVYNDEIVCALSFSNRKIAKQSNVELVRFCNKIDNMVVGGFSKLLKTAILKLQSDIISYCDLRYSNGNMYIKNNFKLLHRSYPNYFYTKDCINLESRLKYQKHKLQKLPSYSIDKTETQIMYESGFRKIYDCGNYTFLYRFKK